ncbi:MAG: phytanoyl-CoA dioxygenase family protein [Methylobacteriaceae bacterium]|nr:phytanoyl-CoA dioxygenase family protein [Methylobacteriaceae bacterium]
MEIPPKVLSRDWTAMTAAEQRAFFSQNGFLVVPQAFSRDELQAMYREIEQYQLEKNPKDMMEAFCTAPSFAAMIDNPKIISAVRSVLGPDVICFKGAYVVKKSKENGAGPHRSALHMDYAIGESEGDFRNSNAMWVNVACYLTDMTFEHAPFAVVPGSHHHYHLTPGTDMESLKDDAVTVLAKAGDALIFLHNTVHAGGANVSGSTQHILFCSYRPTWARPIGRVVEWPKAFVAKTSGDRQNLISDINKGFHQQKRPSFLDRVREMLS